MQLYHRAVLALSCDTHDVFVSILALKIIAAFFPSVLH